MSEITLAALAIFGLFFVLLVLAFVYASRYKKVGPNEVLVVSGRGSMTTDTQTGRKTQRSFRIVRGGGTFIWPVVERVDNMSLELMTIDVVTTNVYTLLGVPVTVDGLSRRSRATCGPSSVLCRSRISTKTATSSPRACSPCPPWT